MSEFSQGWLATGAWLAIAGLTLFSEILVGTDEIFHWLWNIGHDMFLHPIVKTLTFGKVDLDVATELAEPVSE